jgi:death-on-curing protein
VQNHSFVDGNKRLGHAVMEVFLILNGHEIQASVDEQENLILGVASSQISRDSLIKWLTDHIFEIE